MKELATETPLDSAQNGTHALGGRWEVGNILVVDEDGSMISDGYHEISLDKNGGYRGTRRVRMEPVMLYPTSK